MAATAKQDSTGQLTEALTFGGAKVDAAQRNRLYNNGSVLDAKDWGWRAESGDWRFFYFDVPATPPAGTQFLALTNFAGPAPHDDLDTLIFGRTVNSYQLADGTDAIFAPYALGTVGACQNTNVGAGVWLFSTAFGLSQPRVTTETAHQDDPDDPSTASVKRSFTLAHAGQVTISTALPGNDIDEYVLRDANGDGKFTPDEIIGSSTTGSGDESVELVDPADGNYQVWVHGFAVSGIPTFPLTLDAVQGDDLTVTGVPSGPVAAGTAVTLHVAFSRSTTAGQDYTGELQLGPPAAPTLLCVPIVVHRR